MEPGNCKREWVESGTEEGGSGWGLSHATSVVQPKRALWDKRNQLTLGLVGIYWSGWRLGISWTLLYRLMTVNSYSSSRCMVPVCR